MALAPSREDIRRVTVILAGSRTGSSFLFSALKAQGEFLAPTGEETPFYRLCDLGRFTGPGYSDAIDNIPDQETLNKVFEALTPDLGLSRRVSEDHRQLAAAFLRRLDLQWPGALARADYAAVENDLIRTLESFSPQWTGWDQAYLAWIFRLREKGYAVSTKPYSAAHEFEPPPVWLEEPPFITPEPQIPFSPDGRHPLLLKTSTNVYRTGFLRALFPRAEFKWIVLRRNPAAALNGLMDGWLSGGFHSHDVSPHVELKIGGYSDVKSGGGRYWKFDMPPGWQELVSAPLAEVCAFQWLSAYQAIEKFRATTRDAVLDVNYETLISPRAPEIFRELIGFAGATEKPSPAWKHDIPVASVEPPACGKWKKRGGQIVPLLEKHRGGLLLDMAEQMNYERSCLDAWP